ncbi:hypothetical protein ACFSZS_31905 [Seohaeicola zhoushanensis]
MLVSGRHALCRALNVAQGGSVRVTTVDVAVSGNRLVLTLS